MVLVVLLFGLVLLWPQPTTKAISGISRALLEPRRINRVSLTALYKQKLELTRTRVT